jgi:predicted house-cleaning noncanonical NTP pyrophosphatase (MazG superfamily)
MKTFEDKLDKILEIPSGSIIKKPPERKMVESNANDLNTDYRYARENIYNIIERGQEAIEDLLQDARDSGNARMFEVVGQLIKTVGEQNQNLVNVHKQVKDITQDTKAVPSNVTNALFVGSTAELQKMLKDKKE